MDRNLLGSLAVLLVIVVLGFVFSRLRKSSLKTKNKEPRIQVGSELLTAVHSLAGARNSLMANGKSKEATLVKHIETQLIDLNEKIINNSSRGIPGGPTSGDPTRKALHESVEECCERISEIAGRIQDVSHSGQIEEIEELMNKILEDITTTDSLLMGPR